jgi:hypothetical protein
MNALTDGATADLDAASTPLARLGITPEQPLGTAANGGEADFRGPHRARGARPGLRVSVAQQEASASNRAPTTTSTSDGSMTSRALVIPGMLAWSPQRPASAEVAHLCERLRPDRVVVSGCAKDKAIIYLLSHAGAADVVVQDPSDGPFELLPGWVSLYWKDESQQAYAGQRAIASARDSGVSTLMLGTQESAAIRETATRRGESINLWGIDIGLRVPTLAVITTEGDASLIELPK